MSRRLRFLYWSERVLGVVLVLYVAFSSSWGSQYGPLALALLLLGAYSHPLLWSPVSARRAKEAAGCPLGLVTDCSIKDPSDDTLDRMAPAHELTRRLHECLTSSNSVVIGLNAPWGWGKTSFLKLVQHCVDELPHDLPNSIPAPVVVWFHPWWFSGRPDIFRQFFVEVSSQAKRAIRRREDAKQWLSLFADFAAALAGTRAHLAASSVKELLKARSEQASSLAELRRRAENELGGRNQRPQKQVWVFVDDLDRLEPGEVMHFLSLVRTLADLPWTRYFVPYDRGSLLDLIERALLQQSRFDGLSIEARILGGDVTGSVCKSAEPADAGIRDDSVSRFMDKFIQLEIDLEQLVDSPKSSDQDITAPRFLQITAPSGFVPSVVLQFAKNGYKHESFGRDSDRLAWIATYVAGTGPGMAEAIETPREYRREYNRRALEYRFSEHLCSVGIDALIKAVRVRPDVQWLVNGAHEEIAACIYRLILQMPRKGPLDADMAARRFLGAWAERGILLRTGRDDKIADSRYCETKVSRDKDETKILGDTGLFDETIKIDRKTVN